MELNGQLKTIGLLARVIKEIRTTKKKKPDKKLITSEAMKKGLTEELLSSLLDDLVSERKLYIENGSYFVSKTDEVDINEEKADKNGEGFSQKTTGKESNETDEQIDKENNTESVFAEESSNPKFTAPTQHSECFTMKHSAVNSTLPDLRIFESASRLAASVADLNHLIERERAINRKITEENFTLRHQLDESNKSKEQLLDNNNNGKVEETNKTPIVYESIEVETANRRKKKKSKKRNNKRASTNVNSSDDKCHAESQTSAIPEEIISVTVKDNGEQQDKQQARRNTVILGDSLVKNVEGWRMTKSCEKNEKIHVKGFSGATVNDMKHYCKPTVESSPDAVILHIGTNNLRNKNQSEVTLAQEIISLAASIEKEQIDVTISALVGRNDEYEDKRKRVNLILADLCHEKELRYVDHPNIDPLRHLNRSRIHLNRTGDKIFEENLLNACKN